MLVSIAYSKIPRGEIPQHGSNKRSLHDKLPRTTGRGAKIRVIAVDVSPEILF
ncbi:MAG: hypothetical protein HOJ89_00720 [Opitutales bacterium]|nr:hypothetical protein [Opitutales bacterium]